MTGESGFTIDEGTVADVPALREMDWSTGRGVGKSDADYITVREQARSRIVLVLRSSGAIAGFLVARVVAWDWEIENVVVSNTYRRHGFGVELVCCLLAEAERENAGAIHLEVRRSNAPAIALYRKCGFEQTGIRKDYYANPQEDALLFSYSLGNSS